MNRSRHSIARPGAWLTLGLFALVVVALALSSMSTARASAPPTVNWSLIWSDEFNQADGTTPDPANWNHEVGGNGWGNAELESYTARPENANIQGGMLSINAL